MSKHFYNCHDGSHHSRHHERVVENPFTDTGRTGTVKVDGSHDSRIVGNKEVAVYSREKSDKHHRTHPKGDTQRNDSADGRSLAVKENRHDEQSHAKHPRHLAHEAFD